MANEPLALSEILARLPDEADFDAACAALMATERGREFLAEYARRNRYADTQIVVSALERVEAAVRGEPAPQTVLGLPEIVSEIERIRAGLAGGKTVDDISAAIERMHDIAFMLHERPVEQSLRDAFDDAIRILSDALTQPAGLVERRQQAIVQLRALAARLQGPIAPPPEIVQPAPAMNVDHLSVAETVATFAGSPPTDKPPPETQLPPDQQPVAEDQSVVEAIKAAELTPDTRLIDIVSSVENVAKSVDGAGDASEASSDLPRASENVLDQAFDNDAFARSATLSQSPLGVLLQPHQTPHENESSGEPVSEQLLPSEVYSQDIIAGPEEDPGDLFEPMPMPSPVPASTVSEEPASELNPSPHHANSPKHANMTVATHSVPHAAASDPLAAVRDLSEEEFIALFS
jgi:hypothetical protein